MSRTIKSLVASIALTLGASAHAQDAGPGAVSWQWSAQPAADGTGSYELSFTGRIAGGYIVYASDFSLDIGPRPTRLKLDDAARVAPRGPLQSTGAHAKKDKAFNGEYRYFEGTARLTQTIAVQPGATRISGILLGQTCREADGTCALFRQPFEVELR